MARLDSAAAVLTSGRGLLLKGKATVETCRKLGGGLGGPFYRSQTVWLGKLQCRFFEACMLCDRRVMYNVIESRVPQPWRSPVAFRVQVNTTRCLTHRSQVCMHCGGTGDVHSRERRSGFWLFAFAGSIHSLSHLLNKAFATRFPGGKCACSMSAIEHREPTRAHFLQILSCM